MKTTVAYSLKIVSSLFALVQILSSPLPCRADPTNCIPAPSSLLSWWRSEGDGMDQTGGNTGTLAGNATFASGEVGQAFVFDGDQDGVEIGTATNLQLQNFSIEAWVKRASDSTVSLNGNGSGMIFALGAGGGGFGFWIQSDNHLTLGKLQV